MANNEQVNVPSLLVILALSGLIVRYLFFSTPASSRAQQQATRESSTARNREAAAAQLQQMFPQVDRRTLLWDLQRNGGNIAATTERVLAGRLETVGFLFSLPVRIWDIGLANERGKIQPPQSFQPPPPPTPPAAAAPSQTTTTLADSKPSAPDLITRYHLQDKLAPTSSEPQETETGKGAKGWSSNKEERQSLLQRRRDQMILEARRKMEAKIAAEKQKTGAPGS
jgi:coupling of ubiquitin conjugation to ER degradation protein 1